MKKNHLIILIFSIIGASAIFMSFDTEKVTYQDTNQSGQAVYDKDGKLLQVRYVRKNAHEDTENMQILADAIEKMKAMDCDDPMSWYMQGAIHGAPFHSNHFCGDADYKDAVNDAWHNCTHIILEGLSQEGRGLHFYTWHKYYIGHFEEVIREVSGKPNFTLPYWEYDNAKYQTLPPLFQDKNSSLYESYRNDTMNIGKRIQVGAGYRDSLDKHRVWDLTSPSIAFDATSFKQFTYDLENVPHNVMHVYLGTDPTNQSPDLIDGGFDTVTVNNVIDTIQSGYMAQLYSPMDPIFWVHHANIDRMYEQWLIEKIDDIDNGGRPDKGSFIKNKWFYRFFQAGKKVLTHYKDLDKVFDDAYGVQDYAYDMFIDNGQYDKKYEAKVNRAITKESWGDAAHQPVELLVATHDQDITVGRASDPQFNLNLDAIVPTIKKVKRETWLLKVDVEFAKVPRGVFSVFVKDKSNQVEHSTKTLAGVMTFFGTGHDHNKPNSTDGEKEDHNHTANMQEVSFRFDITDEVGFENFSGDIDFEIIPSVVTDEIVIDKIQLVKEVLIKS